MCNYVGCRCAKPKELKQSEEKYKNGNVLKRLNYKKLYEDSFQSNSKYPNNNKKN